MTLAALREELLGENITRPDWTQSQERDPSLLWLDKNENTDNEYIQLIKTVISSCYEQINLYPDCSLLYKKLSAELNVLPDNLLLGAGSDGVIRYLFNACISRGNVVLHTHPTFAMYSIYCEIFGARAIKIHYKKKQNEIRLDINSFLKTIHDCKPKLVCLPNPDSPTGTLLPHDELILIIEAAGKNNAIILIDEAYYPFSENTVAPYIHQYPHLVVVRSFSKAWGLAGARVGYAIAQHELIRHIHKVRSMYELGALSTAIAIRILDFKNEMLASVKRLNDGKLFFKNSMEEMGFNTLNSAGSFQHVDFGEQRFKIHKVLEKIVLYRKDFPNSALAGFSRFSATTKDYFNQVIIPIQQALETV